jgi:hypothetical protein
MLQEKIIKELGTVFFFSFSLAKVVHVLIVQEGSC